MNNGIAFFVFWGAILSIGDVLCWATADYFWVHNENGLGDFFFFLLLTISAVSVAKVILKVYARPQLVWGSVIGLLIITGLMMIHFASVSAMRTVEAAIPDAIHNPEKSNPSGTVEPRRKAPVFNIVSGGIVYPSTSNESYSSASIEHKRRHILTITNPNSIALLEFGIVLQLPEPIVSIKSTSQSTIVASPDWVPQELKLFGDKSNLLSIDPYGTNDLIGRWKVGFNAIPPHGIVGVEIITVDGVEGGWYAKAMAPYLTNKEDFMRWYIMDDWSKEGDIPAAPVRIYLTNAINDHIVGMQPMSFDTTTRNLKFVWPTNLVQVSKQIEMQIGKGFRIPGLFSVRWYMVMHGSLYGMSEHGGFSVDSERVAGWRFGTVEGEPVFSLRLDDGTGIQIGVTEQNLSNVVWMMPEDLLLVKRQTNGLTK